MFIAELFEDEWAYDIHSDLAFRVIQDMENDDRLIIEYFEEVELDSLISKSMYEVTDSWEMCVKMEENEQKFFEERYQKI